MKEKFTEPRIKGLAAVVATRELVVVREALVTATTARLDHILRDDTTLRDTERRARLEAHRLSMMMERERTNTGESKPAKYTPERHRLCMCTSFFPYSSDERLNFVVTGDRIGSLWVALDRLLLK
jgi:hypothetical protein